MTVYSAAPRVLVGDVDGDGSKELVVIEGTTLTTFTPLLFGADGSPRTWAAPTLNGYPIEMLLADLDHNGELETVILSFEGYVHVLQPDGSERAGWPQLLTNPGSSGSSLAVGDLNQDGREEIVVSSGQLFVFNSDGSAFSSAWPKRFQGLHANTYGPAMLADVNGDGCGDRYKFYQRMAGPKP